MLTIIAIFTLFTNTYLPTCLDSNESCIPMIGHAINEYFCTHEQDHASCVASCNAQLEWLSTEDIVGFMPACKDIWRISE